MASNSVVFIVDDDDLVRNAVCALVQSMGYQAIAFASAEEFLEQYTPRPDACLICDFRLHGLSGLELQDLLKERKVFIPTILLTAFPRTAVTVRAMRAGAIAVLEKPCDDNELWEAIRTALAVGASEQEKHDRRKSILDRLTSLTPAEHKVMELIVAGHQNKLIAQELDISLRTVENRRQEIFSKLKVDTLAGLIRLVVEAEQY